MVETAPARSLKRIKKRVTANLNDFLIFPGNNSGAGEFLGDWVDEFGVFRNGVKGFLERYARLVPSPALFPKVLVWQIVLRVGELTDVDESPAVVTLDVVEEDVGRSENVYCDQCRVIGWSGHPVCRKRYHFITRKDGYNNADEGYYVNKCRECGESMHLADTRCKSCNSVASVNGLEEWVQQQLEATHHLLHGVVHSNGFGHLLRVNGREGGSKFLSGKDIMNFWDRLCKAISVRKVSVMDVSKKYGLEYRLLHAITNGDPWYGNWGYEFGVGSFALTLEDYKTAVDTLSKTSLMNFYLGRKPRTPLQEKISFYQSLSEQELASISDLFHFIMQLINQSLETSPIFNVDTDDIPMKHGSFHPLVLCSWTREEVGRVQGAMVKVLRAVRTSNWVQWRLLKGAVSKLASPELLNYCLNDLDGKTLPGEMLTVQSRRNPGSGAMEYSLAPVSIITEVNPGNNTTTTPSREHLLQDLRFLYDALLNPSTLVSHSKSTHESAVASAERLLDCKQFVKDYYQLSKRSSIGINPFAIHLLCSVKLTDQLDNYTYPPPEPIILSVNATIADLKMEVSKAFQEVYILLKRFQAVEITDFKNVKDFTPIKIMVPSGASIQVEGRLGPNQMLVQRFRMERGLDSWVVNCDCGARDDDGERMLACDICGTWQHTRCSGIYDSDPVPERFVCSRCCSVKPSNKKVLSSSVSHFRGATKNISFIKKAVFQNLRQSPSCKHGVPGMCCIDTCNHRSNHARFEA